MSREVEEAMRERARQIELRQAAGHDVPTAGTLHDLSYCRRCGATYNSTKLCEPERRPEP